MQISSFFDDRIMDITSERVLKALKLPNKPFRRLFGVKKNTFYRMLAILHQAFEDLHRRGGKPLTKLQIEDKLLLTLQYWREYRTMNTLLMSITLSKVLFTLRWFGWKMPSFAMVHFVCRVKRHGLPVKTNHKRLSLTLRKVQLNVPKKTKEILFRQEKTSYHKDAINKICFQN